MPAISIYGMVPKGLGSQLKCISSTDLHQLFCLPQQDLEIQPVSIHFPQVAVFNGRHLSFPQAGAA